MINLYSDNVAPIPPETMAALQEANRISAMPYGADETTEQAAQALSEVFERRVAVTPVPTGTAANALSMSLLCRSYGAVFATECAHIHTSEGGATEFFTGGAKIVTLPAPEGRMSPDALDEAIGRAGKGQRFRSQPDAISMTNGTELGTVYSQANVAALTGVARRHGLKVHMDGARFANAIARLDCSPADLTWRLGVDVLSLGMTKNSAMGVDLVVCFDEAFADEAAHRARRCGFTFSKMRFASSQVDCLSQRWIVASPGSAGQLGGEPARRWAARHTGSLDPLSGGDQSHLSPCAGCDGGSPAETRSSKSAIAATA